MTSSKDTAQCGYQPTYAFRTLHSLGIADGTRDLAVDATKYQSLHAPACLIFLFLPGAVRLNSLLRAPVPSQAVNGTASGCRNQVLAQNLGRTTETQLISALHYPLGDLC